MRRRSRKRWQLAGQGLQLQARLAIQGLLGCSKSGSKVSMAFKAGFRQWASIHRLHLQIRTRHRLTHATRAVQTSMCATLRQTRLPPLRRDRPAPAAPAAPSAPAVPESWAKDWGGGGAHHPVDHLTCVGSLFKFRSLTTIVSTTVNRLTIEDRGTVARRADAIFAQTISSCYRCHFVIKGL